MWKSAIVEGDARMDGRSKEYREHRKKLESAMKKRNENRPSKFIENIKNKTTEVAYGQGFDTMKPMADLQASKRKKKK